MRLHPYFQTKWAALYQVSFPPSNEDLGLIHRALTPPSGYQPPAVALDEEHLPTPDGWVKIRIYRPHTTPPSAGLIWAHGGGFAFGDLDMPETDRTCREIAARLPAVVLSVDYRTGRRARFPGPSNDLMAALDWVDRQRSTLKIDSAPLLLGGVSAGGNIATGVALRARDQGGPKLAGLLLAYPTLHADRLIGSPEAEQAAAELPQLLRFDTDQIRSMYDTYLGPDSKTPSAYAIPGTADLRGLPPTVLVLAECDGLRPSGEAFAAALANSSVPIETHLALHTPHGFLTFIGHLKEANTALTWVIDTLRQLLSRR